MELAPPGIAAVECMSALTLERLREVLDYDPATGIFVHKISRYRECVGSVAGYINKRGYAVITIDQVRYLAHRLAWFYVHSEWPHPMLDHKDTVRHHNWISNLRIATKTQNTANQKLRSDSRTGYKGVVFRRGRWQGRIYLNQKQHCLGCFSSPEEAHAAYLKAASELFGEFARAA